MDTSGNILKTRNGKDIKQICEDNKHIKWYWKRGDEHGVNNLHIYSSKNNGPLRETGLSKINIPGKWKTDLVHDFFYRPYDDSFWYKDKNRLFVFHPEKGLLFDFNQTYPEIAANNINHLFFDNQKNVWASTDNGVFKIQLEPSPFRKFLSQPIEDYNINTAVSTRGLAEIQGRLWVNGVDIYQYLVGLPTGKNNETSSFKTRRHGEMKKRIFIPAIAVSRKELFLGGEQYVVYNVPEKTHRVLPVEKEVGYSSPWTFFRDSRGRHWCGLIDGGLNYWDIGQDSIQNYKLYNKFADLKKSHVYTFLENKKNGILLIGSSSGIYVLHPEKGIINRLWTGGKDGRYFPHDNIYHLQNDLSENNVVWAATGGGGLIKINIDSEYFSIKKHRQFTVADGLSSNVIYAVYEDNKNHLWLPSDYGIIRFNKYSFANKAYLERDGISHHEFNRISHLKGKDGTLYFGGLNGVTAFRPDDVVDEEPIFDAPLQILNYQQYDGALDDIVDRTSELIAKPEITLKPGDRFFRIDFALLEYQDATQVRYAYRVEGQGKDWIFIEGNSLQVSGLPHGDYTLQIKGQGTTGQFSIRGLEIPIHVRQPFYEKTGFLAGIAILLIAGFFYGYKQRTTALRRKQAELEKAVAEATETIRHQNDQLKSLDEAKSRFFANVSHELRTPITLILGPIDSALRGSKLDGRQKSFLKTAKNNGKKLLGLVNEILTLTKLENSKLELAEKPLRFYPLLRRLVAAFESHAEKNGVNFFSITVRAGI